jgi:hypothetical protein
MVPRRAGKCNEGILVLYVRVWSGLRHPAGLEAISSSLEDRSRDLEGAGVGESGQKGEDGEGAKGRTICSCRIDEMRWM